MFSTQMLNSYFLKLFDAINKKYICFFPEIWEALEKLSLSKLKLFAESS